MKFKDTLLYVVLKNIMEETKERCWYLQILSLPRFLLMIIVGGFFAIIVDFFYFSFNDSNGKA